MYLAILHTLPVPSTLHSMPYPYLIPAAAFAKLLQLYPTLCDPINGSPPGPAVPGILQARTLEWVAISSSNAWKWKVKVKSLSRVRLLATPWTAAYQVPPSMGFSRQEYWSGVPLPSPSVELIQPYFKRSLVGLGYVKSQRVGENRATSLFFFLISRLNYFMFKTMVPTPIRQV